MFHFLNATATATGSLTSSIFMMAAMLAIFYFMLIRPENKRKKQEQEMRSSIKTGDKVVTIGGIIGTVVNVKEDRVVIETSADQVRIEVEKWGIGTNKTAAENAQAAAKKAEEAKAKAKAAKKAEKK